MIRLEEHIVQDMDLTLVINKGIIISFILYIKKNSIEFLIIRCFTIGVKNIPNNKEIFEELEKFIFLELRNIV
jgi:hypothetical protein